MGFGRIKAGKGYDTVLSTPCMTWKSVDAWRYAGEPVDEARFSIDAPGEVVELEIPGLKVEMRKV